MLQKNVFSGMTDCLDIDWSYKRWEHVSPCLHLFGYPARSNKEKLEEKTIYGQDEISVKYRDTCAGESGGPLVNLQKNGGSNRLRLVGVHKAFEGNYSVGLTLNDLENSKEMI